MRHEVEQAIASERIAQALRVDVHARRNDEVHGVGQLLDLSVERVGNAGGKVDDALEQRPVGALQVDDRDLPRTQRVGDVGDVGEGPRREERDFRSAAARLARERDHVATRVSGSSS